MKVDSFNLQLHLHCKGLDSKLSTKFKNVLVSFPLKINKNY